MRMIQLQRAVAAFLAIGIAACALDDTVIVQSTPDVVVHAVLDPGTSVQEILVERTLTGAITINDKARFDTLDPINTGGGIPIAGAKVVINGPDGPVIAVERAFVGKSASYGQGRYLATFGGAKPLRPGSMYGLVIETLDGQTVTGTTRIPNAAPVATTVAQGNFFRERDSLKLAWKAVPFARTYGVRVESPFGPFLLFTDTLHLGLDGMMRNFWANNIERLFIPGFLQVSTLFAVDSNYFDYYRSRNDPFTGSGIINHLTGGIGVFGSSVDIDSRSVNVVSAVTQPAIEGNWALVRGTTGLTTSSVDNFTLWVETENGTSASLSGQFTRNPSSLPPVHDGFAGARDGTRIELQFLNNQDIHSTYARFVGTFMTDSIVGTFSNNVARVVFRKRS